MDKWRRPLILILIFCNVFICINGQGSRGAGTLSSLVRALEISSSRQTPFSARSANGRSLPISPPEERVSRFSPSAPAKISRFSPESRQDVPQPKPSKPTRFETNKPPPPRPAATGTSEFRFDSNRPKPASRITFIPQDRGQRFTRPRQTIAKTSQIANIPPPPPPPQRRPAPTTTRLPPKTTEAPTTEKPTQYYDDVYDYYDDYYYYDDKTEPNTENKALQSVNLGPIDPPVKKQITERERESRISPEATKPKPAEKSPVRSSLADRLAALAAKRSKVPQPISDDLKPSINSVPTESLEPSTPSQKVETTTEPRVEVRVTNTTESTFVVANIQTSRSVSMREEESNIDNTTPSNEKVIATIRPEESIVEEKITNNIPLRPSLTALFGNIDLSINEAREGRDEDAIESSTEPKVVESSTEPKIVEFSTEPKIVDITTEAHKISTTEKTDVSAFLDKIFEKPKEIDPSILPPGFSTEKSVSESIGKTIGSSPSTTTTTTTEKQSVSTISKQDILFAKIFGGPPPKAPKIITTTEKSSVSSKSKEEILFEKLFGKVNSATPSSDLLPEGFTIPTEKKEPITTTKKFNVPVGKPKAVPASLLPKGFNSPQIKSSPENTPSTTTEKWGTSVGPRGLVFPKRNKKPSYLTTTTTTPKPEPAAVTIGSVGRKRVNLFERVRTGSPKPITTPIPALRPKIPAAARPPPGFEIPNAHAVPPTTTTTKPVPTTTTLPPKPTTPGVCGEKCRLFATLRITEGAKWVPELKNRDTKEWQNLAKTVSTHLNSVYQRSRLNRWFIGVEIDSFNEGSVLVDYVVQLTDVSTGLDTVDLKHIINGMLENSNQADYRLGPMKIDPEATDFVVIKEQQRSVIKDDGSYLIPEWLIAVIVISLASFLFIIIFGITVLVSRARMRRRNVPLTEEVLNKLNANQLAGVDNAYHHDAPYDMEAIWNEKLAAERNMKPPSSRGRGYNPNYNINIYDSWRTDWSGPYGSSATYAKRRPEANF